MCYCGSDNCRGFIGGEKTTQPFKVVDYKPAGTSKKKKEDKKKDYDFSGDMVSEAHDFINNVPVQAI